MDVNNLNANNPLDRRLREVDSQPARDTSRAAEGRGNADGHRSADEARQSRRDDEVRLSDQARLLRDLEHQVSEQDAFDQGRVEKIRTAIAEGRYHVDPERLAERFMELEHQLHQ